MFSQIGKRISSTARHIGQGIKTGWNTIGGIGHKANNVVNKVASFVHGATKDVPFLGKVHEVAGDVLRYSDLFKQGLEYGDKIANSMERVTKTADDFGQGKLNSNQLRDRIREHGGEARGYINNAKEQIWRR